MPIWVRHINIIFPWKQYSMESSNWKIALSSDREESFRMLMAFVKGSNSSILELSADINQLAGTFNFSSSGGEVSLNFSGTCPSGMALSAIKNSNTLDFIKTSLDCNRNKNNDFNLNPIKINKSYSLSFRGLNSTIVTGSGNRNRSFVVTFDELERRSSGTYFFAYSINTLG